MASPILSVVSLRCAIARFSQLASDRLVFKKSRWSDVSAFEMAVFAKSFCIDMVGMFDENN